MANPDWFNIWTPAGNSNQPTGLHQLAMDTFWYIDPDYGLDGVWDNSLASEPPIYNDDFTQMTVKLREGLYWSDGVEFTADDVVFTAETHMNTDGLVRSAAYQINVESVEAPDPYTVVFNLKQPNSRFHALFTVRWNAAWMMPKHVFEGQNPLEFNFNPPVSIGSYTLHSYDPSGGWFTWEKRPDWERTSLARHGEPGPAIRDICRSGATRSTGHRADEPRARHHPRRLARGHVHARPRIPELDRLVRRLPLCSSGSDPAGDHLQPPAREVPGAGRPLGPGAGDRYQGRLHGLLSWGCHHLGHPGPADRHPSGLLPSAARRVARELRARYRAAGDPAVRFHHGSADRGHAAAFDGRPDPRGPGRDHARLRRRLVAAGSRSRGRADGAGRLHPPGQRLVHAERRALLDPAHGRG